MSPSPQDPARAAGWSVLPHRLREPRRAWLAIPVAAAISLAGSALLALILQLVLPGAKEPVFDTTGWTAFILVVLFAPFVETLIMAALLEGLLRVARPGTAVALSAILWGIAHSLAAPAWGLIIWWPFLIFSSLYVVWRRKGKATAILVVTAVHALQNLLPAIQLLHA